MTENNYVNTLCSCKRINTTTCQSDIVINKDYKFIRMNFIMTENNYVNTLCSCNESIQLLVGVI